MSESFTPYAEGSVTGFLHKPGQAASGAIVLTHGAGLDCEAPLIVSISEALCQAGFIVLRCNLRFRQKRRIGPPHPGSAADDRLGLREAVSHLETMTRLPIYLGGHSYGGRQASILMTETDPPPVRALLLLSYPLHPPRRPDQLRSTHFPHLKTPAFFFHGSRDPFGSPEELKTAFQFFPASTPVRLVLVDKAGHELSPSNPSVASHCASEFSSFIATTDLT